jgi:hypothetical protein
MLGTHNQLLGPGKADAADLSITERTVEDFIHVYRVMCQTDLILRGGIRYPQFMFWDDLLCENYLAQNPIFFDRETVVWR